MPYEKIVTVPSDASSGQVPVADGSGGFSWGGQSGGSDASLGITGASVGQIAKVTAVDANGKPTAWEPVDMPRSGKLRWQKIQEVTLEEQANTIAISTDSNGTPVADYAAVAMKVEFTVPADATQTDNNGAPWIYPTVSVLDSGIRVIGSIAGWKTTERRLLEYFAGDINGIFASGNVTSQLVPSASDKPNITVMDGVTLFINGTSNHWPAGTVVSLEALSERA